MPRMTTADIEAFLAAQFPQIEALPFKLERVEERLIEVRLLHNDKHLRPGGTISGPALMSLADAAMYMLVLSLLGPVTLAVTTNLNINFLRKPQPGDVLAQAELLK